MLKIPKPDDVNEDGEPIDVMANLRAKKELFAIFADSLYDDVCEAALVEDDEKVQALLLEQKAKFEEIARAIGHDLDKYKD